MTHEAESPVALAIALLAAGQAPDWVALSALADTAADRALLAELEMVQRVAAAVPGWEGAPPSDTIGIPAPDLDPGEAWGSLRVIETIARGAHGAVFRAWDTRLARMVALKLVRYDDASAADALREARLIAQLNHPGIIAIHGADRQGATVGWWMPLIDGQTLEDLVIGLGPQSDTEATAIAIAVGGALGAVHAAGLIHNDVKLHNIMRERGGRIVLMDFSAGRRAAADADEAAASGTPLHGTRAVPWGHAERADRHLQPRRRAVPPGHRAVSGRRHHRRRTAGGAQAAATTGAARRASRRLARLCTRRRLRPGARGIGPVSFCRCARAGAVGSGAAAGATAVAARGRTRRRGGCRRRGRRVERRGASQKCGAGANGGDGDARRGTAARSDAPRVARGRGSGGHAGRTGRLPCGVRLVEQARAVLFAALGTNSLLVGLGEAKMGWMLARAGQHDAAWPQLQTGLHKLQQRGGRDHPYRATVFAAYAASLQQAGRHAEALVALREALAIRQHFLGIGQVTAAGVASAIGVTDDALGARSRWVPSIAIGTATGCPTPPRLRSDWIPRACARMATRSMAMATTTATGGPIASRSAGTGIRPGSSRTTAPSTLDAGFRAVRPFSASAATDADTQRPTWNLVTGDLGHYSWDLLESFKRAAAAGFTLTSRSRLRAGGGYVGVDLLPAGPRFDIDSYFTDAGEVYIKNNTSIVPQAGPEHVVGRHAMPLVRLEFSLASGATVWIDGRRRGDSYRGMTSYQAGEGLFFGAYNVFSRVPNGMADYALVHVVVPPPPGRR